MTTSGTKDNTFETTLEIFRGGKVKYQLIWTNNNKQFLIDGKLVTEVEWNAAIEEDKK